MQWWNNLVDWSGSDHGWQIISGAVVPFIAIVVAGLVAALIGRGATKRVLAMQERESRNAAVAGVISAARKAATWGSLGHDERGYADHLAEDADIRLRLLPVSGAPVAANWAQHEIADIKKNSSTFSFQAEQSLAEFRDRMLEWQARPSRTRKLFRSDLERWKFEAPDSDADLINRQQAWNADQVDRGRQPANTAAASGRATGSPDAAAGTGAAAGAGAGVQTDDRTPAGAATTTAPATEVAASSPQTAPREQTTVDAHPSVAPVSSGAVHSGMTPNGAVPGQAAPGRATASGAVPAALTPIAAAQDDDLADRTAAPLTEPKVDAAAPAVSPTTASITTRLRETPAEHSDPHETDEAPYGSPVSASELRRRSADDDE